jgi:hypothetical protein
MSTDVEALVGCPDCHARKRQPCVYLEPRAPAGTSAYRHQAERAGKPTKRPHRGRFQKADALIRRRHYEEATARNALSPERDAVLRAHAQAVAEEHRQLGAWLSQHAEIFVR